MLTSAEATKTGMAISLLRTDFSFLHAGETKTFLGEARVTGFKNQLAFERRIIQLIESPECLKDKIEVDGLAMSRNWPNSKPI